MLIKNTQEESGKILEYKILASINDLFFKVIQ